jgi:hypothetical protein
MAKHNYDEYEDYENWYDGGYGYFDNKVTSYKPNSRKRPQLDMGGLFGWYEIWVLLTGDRRARKEAKRRAQQQQAKPASAEPRTVSKTASAKFTPHEEKKKKVRFTVIDD